jgi:acyl carrier protein
VNRSQILSIVLDAIRASNDARLDGQQLEVSSVAPLMSAASPLDSLGLVALLIDIEEAFDRAGHPLTLSDERAMSLTRSPFRDVPSLVAYIGQLTDEA